MHPHSNLADHLRELEESLLDPSVRKSERVAELLAPGFFEIGGSGRMWTREQVISALCDEAPVVITASEFEVRLLASNVALVSYRACRHSEPPLRTRRASIWQLIGERWQMVFHQGTLEPVDA